MLAETIVWCSQRPPSARPADALWSAELRPAVDSLSGLNEGLIQPVIEQRRRLLHANDHTPASNLAGGRLLVYEPDDNLFDGAAQMASDGFFDVDNVPPWDTWLGYIYEEQFKRVCLLSWVPPVFLALADDGIEANPELCIRWAVDVKHEFLRQLHSIDLLA